MQITLIAAMTTQRVIGVNNQLPWHMPADLQHFKSKTLHKPVIMGRKTFDSIGQPLPKRRNLIVTRQIGFKADGCEVFQSIDTAIHAVAKCDEVMIIGGAGIYQQTIDRANRMYLTIIDSDIKGDAYFPKWHDKDWVEISNEAFAPDAENPLPYRFVEYRRI